MPSALRCDEGWPSAFRCDEGLSSVCPCDDGCGLKLIEQIVPVGVHFFNQVDFPFP